MHEKYRELFHFEFDDQSLDARVEVVKLFAVYALRSHERVALLAHDRQYLIDRLFTVLDLIGRIHAEIAGDFFGLIDHATANGPGIDLNQPDNIGVHGLDELRYLGKIVLPAQHVTDARQRHMHPGAAADGITNIVQQESHITHESGR